MKKFIALGFVIVLVMVSTFLWLHFDRSRLAGTWIVNVGGNVQFITTVTPNGTYVCRLDGLTNGVTRRLEGTEQIKNGFLIDLCTYDSQTNTSVPRTNRFRIIRMNDHEMVLKWDGNPYETVVRKIER